MIAMAPDYPTTDTTTAYAYLYYSPTSTAYATGGVITPSLYRSPWPAETPAERRQRALFARRAPAINGRVPPCSLDDAVLDPPDDVADHQADPITRAIRRRRRETRPLRSRPGARR